MVKTLLASASLLGLVLVAPAFAQQKAPSAGDVLDVNRGQGSSVTGSSELAKGKMPQNGPSQPGDAAMIGKEDPQHQDQAPTTGDTLNVQRGQGTAVTGSSESSKVSPAAGGIPNTGSSAGTGNDGTPTPGQTMDVQRGQGSTATGSSELPAKQ